MLLKNGSDPCIIGPSRILIREGSTVPGHFDRATHLLVLLIAAKVDKKPQISQAFVPGAKLRVGRPEPRGIKSKTVASQVHIRRDLLLFMAIL